MFPPQQPVPTALQSKPTLTKASLAVGAVGAAAVVLFNEAEIVLELLGVVAAGNFLAKKLFFAKDREQTVDQIRYCHFQLSGAAPALYVWI